MTPRLIFLAYARKSIIDARNRMEVESTDRQIARLQAWAVEQGYELELFAEPDGYRSGGSTLHRPAYRAMLQRLRSARPGELAGIVATDLDRTGRLERDMHDLFDEVVSRGVRLIVLDEPSLNLESTDGRFLAGLKVLLAAQERRKVGDRVRNALHDRRARGLHVGWAPYGYRYSLTTSESGHRLNVLAPDPVEAPRLVAILEKYVTDIGIDAVARWCNALGWRTRRGGAWTGASVNELLNHLDVYRGYVLTRGERHRVIGLGVGTHPPLIDDDLAARILAVRGQRSKVRRRGRHAEQPYPLVHVAICAECTSHIVGATVNLQRGKPLAVPLYRYRCLKDRGHCESSRMPADAVEEQVWTILERFRHDLRTAAQRHDRAWLPAPRARPLPEPSTAGAIRAEMERLNTIFQKGRIDEARYDRDYAALDAKLAAAIATVETIGSPADPLGLLVVEKLMADFDEARRRRDRTTLAKIVKAMVERVVIYRGEVVECRLIPLLERQRALLAELE